MLGDDMIEDGRCDCPCAPPHHGDGFGITVSLEHPIQGRHRIVVTLVQDIHLARRLAAYCRHIIGCDQVAEKDVSVGSGNIDDGCRAYVA